VLAKELRQHLLRVRNIAGSNLSLLGGAPKLSRTLRRSRNAVAAGYKGLTFS